jgi:ribulose-phosphate 3-epimerase
MSGERRKYLVAPSLLAGNHARLAESALWAQEAGADWLHVDVMDGHFVPNLTFGPETVAALSREENFHLPLDVHLMLDNPSRYVGAFLKAGAAGVTVHVEPADDIGGCLRAIQDAGALPGLAINPATPWELLQRWLPLCGLVLCMTVNPGFGGQAFMPEVLDKVRALDRVRRREGMKFLIEVDGGVDESNAADCYAAGVDVLVAGTSLYRQSDMCAAVRRMRANVESITAVQS